MQKLLSIEFCTKKSVGAYVYLPLERRVAPKIVIFWNIKMFKNGEVDSLWDWTRPKIRIIFKNALNEESHIHGVF